jgi:hypothetical protein
MLCIILRINVIVSLNRINSFVSIMEMQSNIFDVQRNGVSKYYLDECFVLKTQQYLRHSVHGQLLWRAVFELLPLHAIVVADGEVLAQDFSTSTKVFDWQHNSINASCSPSLSCYCYWKVKEAKPGNLQTRACSFGYRAAFNRVVLSNCSMF